MGSKESPKIISKFHTMVNHGWGGGGGGVVNTYKVMIDW